jgi:Outer membrane lipoprotein carrier protein LolA-like
MQAAAQPTSGSAPAPRWLGELMGRLARIGERHATFREERRFAALTRPLMSQGWLVYRRPSYLEKTTAAPQPEHLVVDGDRLTVTEGDAAPRRLSLDSQPEVEALVDAIRGPLSGDLAALERSYRVQADGRLAAWRLTLTPTDPRVQAMLRAAEIEGADTDVRQVRIIQANGDEQRMDIQSESGTKP